ncbi:hypothetical protein BFL38_14280 [Brachyspira hampsonii]|uniref:Uncharacterized protein n=1 Tax=Brachyspira hampsonii TaxID=1287055 RepID=A0A1E5NH16_9SPIR|nr:hypothetical protein [Brachyspira hampsonii]OEJ15452.1 hypothetical protein BFL38_14280 [Brachyspira hampsonii]
MQIFKTLLKPLLFILVNITELFKWLSMKKDGDKNTLFKRFVLKLVFITDKLYDFVEGEPAIRSIVEAYLDEENKKWYIYQGDPEKYDDEEYMKEYKKYAREHYKGYDTDEEVEEVMTKM